MSEAIRLEWVTEAGKVVRFGFVGSFDAAKSRAQKASHPPEAALMRVSRDGKVLTRFLRRGNTFDPGE